MIYLSGTSSGLVPHSSCRRGPYRPGYELRAFIFARCERGNVDRRDIAQKICKFPYVVRCNVVAGDWDLLIEVVSPSMDSLGDAILDGLSKVGGIANTQTMVSFYDYSGPASSLR